MIERVGETIYAVVWEGSHEEGFPALLAGGWPGNSAQYKKLFSEIERRALVHLRWTRELVSGKHTLEIGEGYWRDRAQETLYTVLSNSSLEMRQGKFTLADLGGAGKIRRNPPRRRRVSAGLPHSSVTEG